MRARTHRSPRTILALTLVLALRRGVPGGRSTRRAPPRGVLGARPLPRPTEHSIDDLLAATSSPNMSVSRRGARSSDLGVTVEAEFAVGEYDIVILGAEDSIGLDTWLRREGYHLPASAARALRPYVAQGTKFFVAKVDVARVRFDEGRALLSPLRVHYQSEEFSLPIRLGLLNSPGTQDLIVHILSPDGRYETANYPNVFIPTNLEVDDGVRDHFGRFYASLFERVRRQRPDAVVTEYAWGARSCDPCPDGSYGLLPNHLYLLGADQRREFRRTRSRPDPRARRMRRSLGRGHILTRLHYRYDRGGADRDLVFRRAAPVVGGRGTPNQRARMPRDVRYASTNAFQARYAILHRWQGPIRCAAPRRGLWGGPAARGIPAARPALNLSQRRPTRRLAPFFPNSSVPPLRTRPWSAEEN